MSANPPAPTAATLLEAANAAYTPGAIPAGMTPLLDAQGNPVVGTNPEDGFYAAAFKDVLGNIIIAYQGTDPTNSAQDALDLMVLV